MPRKTKSEVTTNLILIPGWGSDERLWAYQSEHLSDIASIKVIVLKEQVNREAMVEHVLSLAPEKFVIAGHSLGGWVAQAVAAKAGNRVHKLILVATWTRFNAALVQANYEFQKQVAAESVDPWLRQNLQSCLHPSRLADTTLTEAILKMQLEFPKTAFLNQSEAMCKDNETLPLLESIICPTLVISARQDQFFALDEASAIATGIPNCKMTIIEDCGHMIPMEQPQATTALLRLWLSP